MYILAMYILYLLKFCLINTAKEHSGLLDCVFHFLEQYFSSILLFFVLNLLCVTLHILEKAIHVIVMCNSVF